tara:strand:+ start:1177 stop:1482 length:306 start_codon:yes stop_codon:yes gene_type:complete
MHLRLLTFLFFSSVGIGVDDMFILISEFQHADTYMKGISNEHKIGIMLQRGGISITITSLTDALAFATGAITDIPAIRLFAAYAVFGIILDYLFQVCLEYT